MPQIDSNAQPHRPTLWLMSPVVLMLLLLMTALGLSSCMHESRIDVSQQDEFKRFVGMQFEVIGSVDAYGIRPNSQAVVEYVTLIPPPGIEGSEIGFRVRVQAGSKVTIQKVVKTNRVFDPDLSFEVRLEGTPLPLTAPVRLDLFRGNEGEDPMQLNPRLYRSLRAVH